MIEARETGSPGLVEIRIESPVTEQDYTETLIPALDKAIEEHERVRALVMIDARFSDFTLGAIWNDARYGLKHWRGFDRIAVVTAESGIARATRALAVFMPCPVMTFSPGEEDEARRWLTESLGSIHQTDLGSGALHVQLLGKLDSAVYEQETRDIDAFIRRNDRFRLLLDLREFDGWQGLGGVAEHFRLVRDHVDLLERAAIVGDAGWQKMAVEMGNRVLGKDVRYFKADETDKAKAWITEV